MSVIVTGPGRVTLRGLLVPLSLVVVWAVAWGLVLVARALAEALFATAGNLVGWVPWLGGKAKASLESIAQRISNRLGAVAAALGEKIGGAFHDLGVAVFLLGRQVYQSALIEGWLVKQIDEAKAGYDALWQRLRGQPAEKVVTERVTRRVKVIEREIRYPGTGRVGAAVRKQTLPLRTRIDALERWAGPRVAALTQATAVAIPGQIGHLRGRARRQERALDRLWARLRRLERPAAATLGVAALVQALIRAKLGWLWCRNVKRAGRGVCRMDPGHLDELLAGLTVIVGAVSLLELTKATQDLTDEAVAGLKLLIREL